MKRLSTVLLLAGLSLLLVPLAFSAFTNVIGRHQQEAQVTHWLDRLDEPRQRPTLPKSAAPPAGGPRAAGAPPFLLSIPKIDLRWLIHEGTSIPEMRRHGAGHIPNTALPGQSGIVGIAGHRTTYGAPFFRLNRVGPGDVVMLQTKHRTYVYRVFDTRQVRPTQVEILRPRTANPLLVLITCSPPYSAKFRLAVFARLEREIVRS